MLLKALAFLNRRLALHCRYMVHQVPKRRSLNTDMTKMEATSVGSVTSRYEMLPHTFLLFLSLQGLSGVHGSLQVFSFQYGHAF